MARLPTSCSILTAALYAICNAISFLKSKSGNYVIFSDSLSAIRSLQAINKNSHYLSHRIARMLAEGIPVRIIIEWVLGHEGIAGNEEADVLAKRALKLLVVTEIGLSTPDIKKILTRYYLEEWQSQWSRSVSSLRESKHSIGFAAYQAPPRRKQIAISRLKLRVTRLSHEHYFNNSEQKNAQIANALCLHSIYSSSVQST